MSLADAVVALQAKVAAVAGIVAAPSYPPESMNQFPFAVAYPATGTWQAEAYNVKRGLHTIFLEIHLTRASLPAAVEMALDYHETVVNAIMADPYLSGTVDGVLMEADVPIRYTFGRLEWTGTRGRPEPHIGWRFEITVKMRSATA